MSETYDKMRRPPVTALREIKGGRLKGKTDINPQWRYEIMDATYGPCGTGWKYEIERVWTEPGPGGQLMCFSQVKVYTKKLPTAEMHGTEWSDPIPGIGGSMLIEQESSGVHVSDEGYKMATTDALSVALKMLGVGADIYAGLWDGAKYKDTPPGAAEKKPENPKQIEFNRLVNAIDENQIPVYDETWRKKWRDMAVEKGFTVTINELKKDLGITK